MQSEYQTIIIGGGVAGMTAALYLKRAGENVAIIECDAPGGQITRTSEIENYPGILKINGPELAFQMYEQVTSLEVPFVFQRVISLELENDSVLIHTKKQQLKCQNLILTLGRNPKKLGIENEKELSEKTLDDALYLKGKKLGYPDKVIERISKQKIQNPASAVFKMVDTCAAEFKAETPYFYSTYDTENEALEHIQTYGSGKPTVIVFGSGPIRIGQGIEFDYASVHCVWALKEAGYEVVIANNNPETVSTDFDTADRLYFDALTPEDVMNIIKTEKPYGVVVAFGGQTAIKLTKFLEANGVKILGTPADSIDAAEDRERFDELLESLHIERPAGYTVMRTEDALKVANNLGYPVLMRPSYVLGGQNMIIAHSDEDIREYMQIILSHNIENPILIDKYLMGVEIEVDAICDGEEILIPGIMEHIERAGIHSGDSIAVYPAWNVSGELTQKLIEYTKNLAVSLKTKGLVNIQYVIYENQIYVIEVNPRSSRTIPYISKVTGVPMVDLATRAMLGEKLKDMGYGTGLYKTPPYVAVKVPVFSFEKLIDVDVQLGPEMKSTGEVLGIGKTLSEALYKGLIAAGYKMKKQGAMFVTVRDADKAEIVDITKKYASLGFEIYATKGTANVLLQAGISVKVVNKIHESKDNSKVLLESGKINYIISTSSKGRLPSLDSVKIRRLAVEHSIPCLTSLDTANALADSLISRFSEYSTELIDINHMREKRMKLPFTKLSACGNDYIYFNCLDGHEITSPESLAVSLSHRHFGIGGDGVVLMEKSDIADVKMRMYNLDGSEGRMCGNALRCIGKYVYENGYVPKTDMTVETLSGVKQLKLFVQNGVVDFATVNMGKAILEPEQIPVRIRGLQFKNVLNYPVNIDGKEYSITCISMGNPHAVVFWNNLDNLDIEKIGPAFEYSPLFPERVNVEFVQIINSTTLKMRVWERGSGETWACGTGACAAAVAAVLNGYCSKEKQITVKLKGGDLLIKYTDDTVYLSGKAEKVYEGVVEI